MVAKWYPALRRTGCHLIQAIKAIIETKKIAKAGELTIDSILNNKRAVKPEKSMANNEMK